jgi:hypothetical protein
VVAEIGLILLANFFCRRLLTVFGIRGVVLDTHFAHVQLRIAGFADFKTTQRQAKSRERGTAAPTN